MTQFKDVAIVKTVAEDDDILLLQNPTIKETYQIKKVHLLSGLATGSNMANSVPSVISSGLIFHVDASIPSSYPGNGAVWNTLVGTENVTLSNCVFESADGGAIVFNGNSVGTFPTPAAILPNSAISVEMWVKWLTVGNGISNIQCLIDNNSSNTGFIIQDFPQSGSILSTPGGATQFPIGLDEWVQIVSTVKGSIAKTYINTQLVATTLGSGSLFTVGANFTIGKWQGGARYLNGRVGIVRMYNRALRATEVVNNFDASRGRFSI